MEHKEIKFLSRGAVIFSLGKVIGASFNYLYLLILARFLKPYWLGTYALGLTIIQAMALLAQAGFPVSLLHFFPIYKTTNDHSRLKGLFWFSLSLTLLVSCLLSLLLVCTAGLVSRYFVKDNNFIRPFEIFCLALPLFSLHSLMSAMLRGIKNIKAMVFIQCAPVFLTIVLFLALRRYFAMNIFAAIFAYIGAYFLAAAFGYKILLSKLPSLLKKEIAMAVDAGKILRYSLPLLFFGSISTLLAKTDILMIGYFLSANMVGFYSPALQLSFLVSFGLYMLNQPFAPLISEHYHNKKTKELGELYKTTTRWMVMLGLPCFLFIILFGKEILRVFGGNFVQAYPALVILSAGQLINAGVGSTGLLLILTKHERFVFMSTAYVAVINIALNLILIPRFGLIGAAIGTAAAMAVFNIMNIGYVKKTINMQPYTANYYKPVLSGCLAFFLIFFIKHLLVFADYKLELIILGGLFFVIYVLLCAALRFEKQETYVLALIKKRILSYG